MSLFLFIVFIILPIAEIAVFIKASQIISIPAVIGLTLATAFTGSFLMRMQGFATLNRFMQSVEKGETPVIPILDGMGILVAGVLLLTPGLLTDTIGLLLFVPAVRRWLGRYVFQRLLSSGKMHFHYNSGAEWADFRDTSRPKPGTSGWPKDTGPQRSDNVVDAEFETINPDDDDKDDDTTGTPAERVHSKSNRDDKHSPWRKK
ncbi:MAG: FxsA family protein [Alphaproteobacteria bacterium]